MVMQRLVRANIQLTEKMLANRAQFIADMRPPLGGEIAAGFKGLAGGLKTGMNGGMYNVTTSAAALNALCAFEVFCWFCVGECIGKGSLVGYNV